MANQFHAPESIEDALRLRRQLADACFLAGGTEINGERRAKPAEQLIWLGRLGLGGIARREAGVSIGAMATLQEILESGLVHPAIHQAARHHANRNIRNAATIGGHLALARSCADLIPVLLALGARLRIVTEAGERELDLERWIAGERDGLLLSVEVPDPPDDLRVALEHHSRTANDVSILTVAVSFGCADGHLRGPILAVGGVAASVIRLRAAEAALDGKPLPDREQVEALVEAEVEPIDDIRGSAAFKQRLAAVLVERALRRAWNGEECI